MHLHETHIPVADTRISEAFSCDVVGLPFAYRDPSDGGTEMLANYLRDPFAGPDLPPQLRWHCEPGRWALLPAERALRIEPDTGTDFWRKTHYGFEFDNGHFLHAAVAGDFVLTAHVRFRPAHQYDQAGLMVRLSPTCWLKTSIEHEVEGPSRLGAVVTSHGYSDWSTQGVPPGPGEVWLRVRREGYDYLVESSRDGHSWEQMRLAHLQDDLSGAAVAGGVYACSPKGAGFVAEFRHLSIDTGRLKGDTPPGRPPEGNQE